jgi:hypothetical protein
MNIHELKSELNNLTKVVKMAYLKKDKSILDTHKFGYLFENLNVVDFQHRGNQANYGKKSRGVRIIMRSSVYSCEFYGGQSTSIICFKVNYKKFASKDRQIKFVDYGNVMFNN